MPKKYRNPQGEMLYTFVWEGGGGNMVYAPSKAVARRRAIAFGKSISDSYGRVYPTRITGTVTLVPIMSSLSSVSTFSEYLSFDRGLAMMCI
jgi:hypothetical protein|tara:strand:+ start:1162 stop:1437 length:276 start_codon:yes stop_codon:yes gene_type:complete